MPASSGNAHTTEEAPELETETRESSPWPRPHMSACPFGIVETDPWHTEVYPRRGSTTDSPCAVASATR